VTTQSEFHAIEDAVDRRLALDWAGKLALAGHGRGQVTDVLISDGDKIYAWLRARKSLQVASLVVGDPVITSQADPDRIIPLHRTGPDMAVVMTDGDQATYPAPSEADSAGFPITGDNITITEDSDGAVVALTVNPDGSSVFAAVAPGAAQVTWTDGTVSFSDTINVTTGEVASMVVGAPVIAAKAAAAPPADAAPPATPPATLPTS
jgi:hypothetical protein